MLLEGKGVTKSFGGLKCLDKVDFCVNQDEVVGLIGPNGSGKTTLFNLVTGVYKPSEGTITFKGKRIDGRKPHEIAKLGIARTFQIVQPFADMTVLQNVAVSTIYGRDKAGNLSEGLKKAEEWIDFCGLEKKKNEPARNLTYADLKRLEIARAVALGPELILLDEVVAGLNSVEMLEAVELLGKIRKEAGITIFMVEHVMKAVMSMADRIIVLNSGVKIAEGTPRQIADNIEVVHTYLGEPYHA